MPSSSRRARKQQAAKPLSVRSFWSLKDFAKSLGVAAPADPIDVDVEYTDVEMAKVQARLRHRSAWSNSLLPCQDEKDHLLLVHPYWAPQGTRSVMLSLCRNVNDPEGKTVSNYARQFLQQAASLLTGEWASFMASAQRDMVNYHPVSRGAMYFKHASTGNDELRAKALLKSFDSCLPNANTPLSQIAENDRVWWQLADYWKFAGDEQVIRHYNLIERTESIRRAVTDELERWRSLDPTAAYVAQVVWQETLVKYVSAAMQNLQPGSAETAGIKVAQMTNRQYQDMLRGAATPVSVPLDSEQDPVRLNGLPFSWIPPPRPPLGPSNSTFMRTAKVSHPSGAPALLVQCPTLPGEPFSERSMSFVYSFCLNDEQKSEFLEAPQWKCLGSFVKRQAGYQIVGEVAIDTNEPWTVAKRKSLMEDAKRKEETENTLGNKLAGQLRSYMDKLVPERDRSLDPMICVVGPKTMTRAREPEEVIAISREASSTDVINIPDVELSAKEEDKTDDPTMNACVQHSSGRPALLLRGILKVDEDSAEDAAELDHSLCFNSTHREEVEQESRYRWLTTVFHGSEWKARQQSIASHVLEPWTTSTRSALSSNSEAQEALRRRVQTSLIREFKQYMKEETGEQESDLDPLIITAAERKIQRSKCFGEKVRLERPRRPRTTLHSGVSTHGDESIAEHDSGE